MIISSIVVNSRLLGSNSVETITLRLGSLFVFHQPEEEPCMRVQYGVVKEFIAGANQAVTIRFHQAYTLPQYEYLYDKRQRALHKAKPKASGKRLGTSGNSPVEPKYSAAIESLIGRLSDNRMIVLSQELFDISADAIDAVGVLFDAAMYKHFFHRKKEGNAVPEPHVFWTLAEVDADFDLCLLDASMDVAICHFTRPLSVLRNEPDLEVWVFDAMNCNLH
jgi:hypothetical protein